MLLPQNLPRNHCRVLTGLQCSAADEVARQVLNVAITFRHKIKFDPELPLSNSARIKTVIA
jgi:hypothetical protein